MTTDPRHPAPPPAQRSRGLIVTISVLLVAVVALAIALVLALTGGDDAADEPTGETTLQAPDAQASQPQDNRPQENRPQRRQEHRSPQPTETLDPAESTALLLEQARRDPRDPYAVGDVNAEIVIIKYADYRCWYCALWHVEVADALDPYIETGQVRFEYRDYPVRGDESIDAALAARAAGNQGLFWEYGDALYQDVYDEIEPVYDTAYFESVAERVGVPDIAAFTEDMASSDALAQIMKDRDEAQALGISGTPAFIVHDILVPGAVDEDQFLTLVESRLA